MPYNDILYPEWRNRNTNVKYPFTDISALTNGEGKFIDQDLFDDARLYPIGGSAGIFLSQIEVSGTTVTFTISDPISGVLATGVYDASDPKDDIALYDVFGRPAGILVSSITRLNLLIGSFGPGVFSFESNQAEFVASVAIPMSQAGLFGFELDDGNVVSGDVYLVGVDGVVLSLESGNIRIDALGDPYALAKACDDEGSPLATFCGLKTINGIEPDENGDFKIAPGANVTEDTLIRVSVAYGELSIEQVCTDRLGLSNA